MNVNTEYGLVNRDEGFVGISGNDNENMMEISGCRYEYDRALATGKNDDMVGKYVEKGRYTWVVHNDVTTCDEFPLPNEYKIIGVRGFDFQCLNAHPWGRNPSIVSHPAVDDKTTTSI